MTPTIQLYGFPFTSSDVSNSSLKVIVPWVVWRAMRISNWRISYSMKQSASKWTHFLSHLCVNTWYFLKHFVFYHFHYKYDYTNGILCHNSCSTSFQSLKKKHHYTYTWEFSFVNALLIWVGGFGSIYYFLQKNFEYILIKFFVLSFIFFSVS